jgi:hypothetical protein
MDDRHDTEIRIGISAHRPNKRDNRDRKSGVSIGDNGATFLKRGPARLGLDARSTPALEIVQAIEAIP